MPKGHAVIDGSNLATEGRKEPNLAQLNDAVETITAEYNFAQITVIVDATFEHRVAKAETKAARAAIDDGHIITPPAGAIGRGDAFILQVADRAGAVVFSNDSFQEFHGTYDWLFDDDRLVGGKPIPGVGWIYVARAPVRGPVSRRATADSRKATKKKATTTPSRAKAAPKKPAAAPKKAPKTEPETSRGSDDGSNNAARWKAFKADYPVGATIAATVDRFSSHGAYGSVDGVVIYLPNRLLGEPAPTKARDVIDLGATVDFLVHRYDSDRNGVDAGLIAVPGQTPAKKPTRKPAKKTTKKTATKKAAAKTTKKTVKKATKKRSARKPTTAKRPAKKAASRR